MASEVDSPGQCAAAVPTPPTALRASPGPAAKPALPLLLFPLDPACNGRFLELLSPAATSPSFPVREDTKTECSAVLLPPRSAVERPAVWLLPRSTPEHLAVFLPPRSGNERPAVSVPPHSSPKRLAVSAHSPVLLPPRLSPERSAVSTLSPVLLPPRSLPERSAVSDSVPEPAACNSSLA
ncbi:Hypothetical predicted protein [Pelobates cultripes]|uniref:Uncharacterized protein n=1 Tax=Pelobates cultripes TaxID=61616 RepID=A0AAD1SDC4_PELCU|nr:Hypothetical predicted protein [Pelobates cultripes]